VAVKRRGIELLGDTRITAPLRSERDNDEWVAVFSPVSKSIQQSAPHREKDGIGAVRGPELRHDLLYVTFYGVFWMWRKGFDTHRLCSSARTRESLFTSMV
jgi:hypothetical protein